MWWISWLIIAVSFFLIDLCLPSSVTIWFALSSAIVGILACLIGSMTWLVEVILFIALTVILFIALPKAHMEKIFKKVKQQSNTETDLGYILHNEGVVVEEINNAEVAGLVEINGITWRAISSDNTIIAKGCLVEVVSMEGNKIYVKRYQGGK